MDEQLPGGALQHPAGGEEGVQGLQQLAAGPVQRCRRRPGAGCRRASGSPASARSGSRSRAATGRGAPGQACAARKPAIAARADSVASSSRGTAGPTTTGPSPNAASSFSVTASGSAAPPSTTTSRSPCTPPSTSTPIRRAARYTVCTTAAASPPGERAHRHRHRRRVRPAQRGGPAGQHVRGVAAQQRVDQQGLQPGVPGAAGLGGAGVDPGGGEGDLAGVGEHRLPQVRLLAGGGQVRDLLLDHVDGDLDQLHRLLQVERTGQGAGRGVEDLVGELLVAAARCAATRPATGRRPGPPASPRRAGRPAPPGTRAAPRPSGPRWRWPAPRRTARCGAGSRSAAWPAMRRQRDIA